MDVTIPAEVAAPPALFEKIGRMLALLLDGLKLNALEEDKEHQDLSFLSGETGLGQSVIARFVMAHKLAQQGLEPEFWFALLGGSFFEFAENQSLKEQLAAILDALPSLDAAAVRKALTRGFNQKEIPQSLPGKTADWIEAFLKFVATRSVSGSPRPTFVKLALEHAGIKDAKKQETFARLFNEHKALTPELLDALEKDTSFKKAGNCRPAHVLPVGGTDPGRFFRRQNAQGRVRRSPTGTNPHAGKKERGRMGNVWSQAKHAAGEIKLPIEVSDCCRAGKLPEAEMYGKTARTSVSRSLSDDGLRRWAGAGVAERRRSGCAMPKRWAGFWIAMRTLNC